jgi:hypothetical protein
MIRRILELLFCSHQNVTVPRCGKQHCLVCGGERLYRIGERPSTWRRSFRRPVKLQRVAEVCR